MKAYENCNLFRKDSKGMGKSQNEAHLKFRGLTLKYQLKYTYILYYSWFS